MNKRLRLTGINPTSIKLDKLFALAEELKISISFGGHYVIINDEDRDESLPPLYLEDIEEGHTVSNFPPCTEFKLVYDCPIAKAEAKRAHQELVRKDAEIRAEKKAKAEAKENERRLEVARRLEESERYILATLKAKYPD